MEKKYIHYCWFGDKPLPKLAKKCIESWKKYLPDYELKEWNESNSNVEECPFIKEAYENKKWAFVADYVRTKAMYEYGGIYFDTDMEIIKPIEDYLETVNKNIKVAVMGCAVNGPGEAREADIGVAGGINEALLFKKGKVIRKIPQQDIVKELIEEIDKY